jgi:hypothetical protein
MAIGPGEVGKHLFDHWQLEGRPVQGCPLAGPKPHTIDHWQLEGRPVQGCPLAGPKPHTTAPRVATVPVHTTPGPGPGRSSARACRVPLECARALGSPSWDGPGCTGSPGPSCRLSLRRPRAGGAASSCKGPGVLLLQRWCPQWASPLRVSLRTMLRRSLQAAPGALGCFHWQVPRPLVATDHARRPRLI